MVCAGLFLEKRKGKISKVHRNLGPPNRKSQKIAKNRKKMTFSNFSNFSEEELRQIIKVICLYTMLEHTTKFLELWDKNKKFEKLFCSIVQLYSKYVQYKS